MTPAEKLFAQIKEDREIRAKATQGEWRLYEGFSKDRSQAIDAFSEVDDCSVFYSEGRCQYADAHFIAIAANNWERKNRQLEIAIEALKDIANRISTSGTDKEGGPDRVEISNDRNRRILDAKKALEEMAGVK